MSYSTIAKAANDPELVDRIVACCATEGEAAPYERVDRLRWLVAAEGDVEAAYAGALTADHPSPGGDETVVTDGQILSVVQANPPS